MEPSSSTNSYNDSYLELLSRATTQQFYQDLVEQHDDQDQDDNVNFDMEPISFVSADESTQSTSMESSPSTAPSKKRKKNSPVWTYFTVMEAGNEALCLLCAQMNR